MELSLSKFGPGEAFKTEDEQIAAKNKSKQGFALYRDILEKEVSIRATGPWSKTSSFMFTHYDCEGDNTHVSAKLKKQRDAMVNFLEAEIENMTVSSDKTAIKHELSIAKNLQKDARE